MPQEINLDGSVKAIIAAPQNHNIPLQLAMVEDDDVTPIPVTGDWKFVVTTCKGKILKTYLSTDGSIVIASNTLTIDFSDLLHENGPDTYLFDMRKDEGGFSARIVHGEFIITKTLAS